MKLKPTHSHTKGESIQRNPHSNIIQNITNFRKETAWEIGSDYEESLDVDEQLNKVVNQLKGKEEKIIEICKRYNLCCMFMIVIIMNEGFTPTLSINKEMIKIANNIGAEILFDLYANPYKSELD
ncbi:hypothetical protein Back11_57650 [Paenibacillus baekrokdamisoli]|uniref:Uncharacterized protein n=1 Tax=Paenibacillus baekrokdamisoli TaxID=1712516 RepID=A0A3G9IZT0_9BACL|nr:hypothetical protein [Paenibacillus baekrokdamisoli]BBH24420.1 hypothetical protein Back11_57650 [Paenibacillus baekrokdamisoli]